MTTREDVRFCSRQETCAGWFYAAESTQPTSTIVMAHGLAGVKEMRLDAYADRFSTAGHNVLVFDYRHFGESTGTPRQLLDIKRQHQDWLAAVAYARSRPDVDPERVVLWGSSLSGGHVMAVAEELHPVAVIAQVPHTSGPASVLEGGAKQTLRLAAHGLLDLANGVLRRKPHYIPATGVAGEAALMTAPEAKEYLALVPRGQAFDQRVAARFALAVGLYSPGRHLRRLDIPVLVQVGLHDRTTPAAPTIKAAHAAPNAVLSRYEAGHFTPYTGELFETFISEQLRFLEAHANPKAT